MAGGGLKALFAASIILVFFIYTVMQSDRNSLITDTFHEPTTYEPYVYTSSEQMISFARHEYGLVGVFRIRMRSLVQNV